MSCKLKVMMLKQISLRIDVIDIVNLSFKLSEHISTVLLILY